MINMNEKINIKDIEKYRIGKGFKTGNSVALILTGLIEDGKKYVSWKDEDRIITEEMDVH